MRISTDGYTRYRWLLTTKARFRLGPEGHAEGPGAEDSDVEFED